MRLLVIALIFTPPFAAVGWILLIAEAIGKMPGAGGWDLGPVCPPFSDIEGWSRFRIDEALKITTELVQIPMGWFGEPESMIGLVLFLFANGFAWSVVIWLVWEGLGKFLKRKTK